jgi:hypothetical protein
MNVRTTGPEKLQIRRVLTAGFPCTKADTKGNAGRAQTLRSLAGDLGKGIFQCRADAGNAGADQSVRTGRGLADMTTRLQGHIAGGAARRLSSPSQGIDLRMGLAKPLVPPFANDAAIVHQHGADQRIGLDVPAPALGQVESAAHPHCFSGVYRRSHCDLLRK